MRAWRLVLRLHERLDMDTEAQQTILVATDFSAGSDLALDRAIELAKNTGARLAIVHAIEPALDFPMAATYTEVGGGFYASVDLALAARAAKAAKAGVVCTTKILEGTVATEIAAWAREIGATMIVQGTHGRTGLAHVLLGSVAEKVVRQATCPVLTVPFGHRAA